MSRICMRKPSGSPKAIFCLFAIGLGLLFYSQVCSGEEWVQIGNDIDGEAWGDNSGWSVSLSSDGNDYSGHVRIFTNLESPVIRDPIWSQPNGFSAILWWKTNTFCRIQWSPNLADWFELASFVTDSNLTPFQDSEFDGTETRFYRAVLP